MWVVCSPSCSFVSFESTFLYTLYGYGQVVSNQTKRKQATKKTEVKKHAMERLLGQTTSFDQRLP